MEPDMDRGMALGANPGPALGMDRGAAPGPVADTDRGAGTDPGADPGTAPGVTIRHAESDADFVACFEVMRQLRPRLASAEHMLAALAPQWAQGYRLLACWQGDRPLALAGYRKLDNLIHGSFLYVDDLVTNGADRGQRHGERLLAALRGIAAQMRCGQLVLDTALSNEAAQRFYQRVGLQACALHFRCDIEAN